MNDSELLLWIAEHMTNFTPVIGDARMDYIDDNGESHIAYYCGEFLNAQCLDLLKGCIGVAVKQMEKK